MNSDAFLAVLKSRRSVREFTECKPTHAQIEQLIEAAGWAPSNHNRQGWKFLVYENKQVILELADKIRSSLKSSLAKANRTVSGHSDELIHFAGAFENAPIVIIAMHKKSPAMGRAVLTEAAGQLASGEAISTAMACQNLLLAAHVMGLAGCIMTAPLFAGDVWKSMKDLPAGFEPTCLITLGYPAGIPEMPKRKKIEHILEYR
jgi:coenzyme F420-0:L-glutamate ligase / coenzyme F420-1:gamma-L-glutamate ligase